MVFAALLLLLSSIKNRKKKNRVLSNFSTTVSYVILRILRVYTCTAPSALLGNVASTKTICCTCNNYCSVSRSSSLVGGRPTPSLLPQFNLFLPPGAPWYGKVCIFLSRAI